VFDSSWVYPSQGNRKWHEPHWQRKEEADLAAAAALPEQPTDPASSVSQLASDAAERHFGSEGGGEPMCHGGEHPVPPVPGMGPGHQGPGGFMPARPLSVICVDKLVTILQPYQENYYHFVAESLPRLIMARDILLKDPSVRLLTRNQPFILQFLEKLGIAADRIETLHHDHVIFANTLYVPTPTKMFSPPQENLLALYQHLAVDVPVQGPRNLVIYTSREGSWSRDVANERFVINAMRALLAKTDLELVVFDGSLGVEETIGLFRRAILVIGPHGAGMTNMLWTQEGTKVIEFLHMSYPLLCYWHMASAMGVEYWMLPIPESSWAGNMVVPVQEVLDILVAALKPHFSADHPEELCAPGTALDRMRGCTPCPPGTYSYHPNSEACTACAQGQFSEGSGSTHCSMCPPGSYSADEGATACTACPPAKGALEPNAPVVWGSRSRDTCPAHIRPDDPRFFHFYGVYATNQRAMEHHGHHSMMGCMHWIVSVLLFALLVLFILR